MVKSLCSDKDFFSKFNTVENIAPKAISAEATAISLSD